MRREAISISSSTRCREATLFDLGALLVELEDLLGVPVDLLTPGDLPPKLRETILADAQPI
jgi:uncharacterized protein